MSHAGERIRQRREEPGLLRDEVAQAVGITPMAYYDLEAYEEELRSVISLDEARRLVRKLGVPLVFLLSEPLASLPDRASGGAPEPLGERMPRFRTEHDLSMATAAVSADVPVTRV